jgi:NAD+ synthase
LWVGQTDEAEMGFSYDALEDYLLKARQQCPEAVAQRIERLRASSDHKRELPPIARSSD